jgi:hypothetical protein
MHEAFLAVAFPDYSERLWCSQNATVSRFTELKHSALSALPSPRVLRGRRMLKTALLKA